jgi:NAD+ kinase
MATVVLFIHHDRPDAARLATEAAGWLHGQGHSVRVPDDDPVGSKLADETLPPEEVARGADLAVSLGGDGTVLRTVELVAPWGVPVLGVNMGRLGYLTEVEAAGLEKALDRFWAGDHQLEARMTLAVTLDGDEERPMVALNDAVLVKSHSGHTVHIGVTISGRPFLDYAADGLIVSTPTGSTAYNLSVRGPIVSPRLRALLVTPVSAHMLFDRALVLEPTETVRVEVLDGTAAELIVDGCLQAALEPGGTVTCAAGERDARFVTFGERDFHHILKAKFGLADR